MDKDKENEVSGTKVFKLTEKNYKDRQGDGSIYQLFMCFVVNIAVLGPSMGFGYSAVALPILKSNSTEGLHVTEDQASWIASALAIGTPFGCIISSFILRRGRKLSLLVTSSVSLISWMIIFFANSYKQILAGRLISGIAMGLASLPASTYSAEVTSPRLRSTTLTWTSIAISCGILIVYIFGYIFPEDWNTVALLCAAFPALAIILTLTIVPESPMWLTDNGRFNEATKVLKKFNGISKNDPLPQELIDQIKPKSILTIKKRNFFENFKSQGAMKPFIIMLSYFFIQQFSGIFPVIYYAVDVTKTAGLTIDGYLSAILIGVTRLSGTIVVALISEKFGRRFPSIISGIGTTIFMLALSIYLILKDQDYAILDGGFVPAVCVIMYIFMNSIGYSSIPFAMVVEIYPSSVKDILSGITTCVAYIFSFVTVKIYPDMISTMGNHGVFFFYAVVCFLGTLYLFIYLPETKGKSLTEIENLFITKNKHAFVIANSDINYENDNMVPLKEVISIS